MVSTTDRIADVEGVLQAVVLGGNVLAAMEGAKKTRRRVPRKQEKLVRAVAEDGEADFERLSETFEREWKTVQKRNRGAYILVPKREFFRNIADLCGRVNAALLAGYREPAIRQNLVGLTSGSYVGLAFDHQRFLVWWEGRADLSSLAGVIEEAAPGGHAPLTGRRSARPGGEHEPSAPTPPVPEPTIAAAPRASIGAADITDFKEDRVTGRWRFELDGRRIEVDRTHGYVKIDGRLFTVDEVRGLDSKEDLADRALEAIRGRFRSDGV